MVVELVVVLMMVMAIVTPCTITGGPVRRACARNRFPLRAHVRVILGAACRRAQPGGPLADFVRYAKSTVGEREGSPRRG